jgi:hypothetical protein
MNPAAHAVPVTAESIPNLVAAIGRALVDYPEEVSVAVTLEDGHSVLVLPVDPRDVGKLVGKQGRTARSLRTILSAAGMKLKHRFSLDIAEADHPRKPPSLSTKLVATNSNYGARRSDEPSSQAKRNRTSESLSSGCAQNSDFRED